MAVIFWAIANNGLSILENAPTSDCLPQSSSNRCSNSCMTEQGRAENLKQ